MRKILTQEEIAVKDRRRNTVISIVLLGIMLLSTLGFAFIYNTGSSSSGSAGSSGSRVQSSGDKWIAQMGTQQLVFSEPPSVVNETQSYLLANVNQYYQKPIYIDSNSDAIYSEIGSTLGQYAQRVQHACYQSCTNSTYPQKTCTDNLIVYTPSDTNKISQNSSCVFIEGDMRAVDAFLYRAFGLA